jgi:hypothetical protein
MGKKVKHVTVYLQKGVVVDEEECGLMKGAQDVGRSPMS